MIAAHLANHFHAPVIYGAYSRLLIDLNRSPAHSDLFSKWTRARTERERQLLLETYHQPHWAKVRALVQRNVSRGARVLHVAVHSFTPILKGTVRQTDIGLLYDESRNGEAALCKSWQRHLQSAAKFKVRRNYPYRGSGDGLTSQLRQQFSGEEYLGVELEFNQKICRSPRQFAILKDVLSPSLAKILAHRKV